jgi:hypothetical protein
MWYSTIIDGDVPPVHMYLVVFIVSMMVLYHQEKKLR